MGFDVLHLNLHKTFSTPHGGGGPGSGPVGVCKKLEPFLPTPVVCKKGDLYVLDEERPDSIGRIRSFQGNFGVLIRAYAYLRTLGAEGLKEVSGNAVLNANYLASLLGKTFDLSHSDRLCKHEFVISAKKQKDAHHVTALDIAKGLIDQGYHPPTIYFPLIVEEALMMEPTETEGKETLDRFAAVMEELAQKAASSEGADELPGNPAGRNPGGPETRAALAAAKLLGGPLCSTISSLSEEAPEAIGQRNSRGGQGFPPCWWKRIAWEAPASTGDAFPPNPTMRISWKGRVLPKKCGRKKRPFSINFGGASKR
jgi:glycine dehydrogenase subunit 2